MEPHLLNIDNIYKCYVINCYFKGYLVLVSHVIHLAKNQDFTTNTHLFLLQLNTHSFLNLTLSVLSERVF